MAARWLTDGLYRAGASSAGNEIHSAAGVKPSVVAAQQQSADIAA
jgi:hypothetical protein